MTHNVMLGTRAMNHEGREVLPIVPDDFLPSGTRCVEIHSSATSLERFHLLDESEQQLVTHAVDKRKADFGDSRWCAHQAMQDMRLDGPILRGVRGMPVFPQGVAGSLTHTEGFRAALIGRSSKWKSLGIDAEPACPLPEGVFNTIARPEERRRLWHSDIAHADKIIFSAKETTYKAWFPLTHRFLDFDQADIDIRPDGTFTSYLLTKPVPVPFIQGRWVVSDGVIITVAGVRR